ncbi:MAG: hypothetical protein P1V20_16710 [Verrucomicrobiales bacterium]|nr:hypothetical protein [Verrucomicrobiales bacterium]
MVHDSIFKKTKWFCAVSSLVLLTSGCVDTSTVGKVLIKPEKRITFLLIDNSLSYNNPADSASQRVMDLVKREITGKLRQARPGDHYIVRTIQSESNQLSAMITNLDLTRDDLHFQKPKPSNPIELKVWEREKRDFEESLGERTKASIDAACSEFEAQGELLFAYPSNQTDFVGALLTCQRFFEKRNYDQKKLIIYSDMIEDAALEDDSQLELPDVTVVARFVTRPPNQNTGGAHQYFKQLEQYWQTKLNAEQFELYEVQNSF